MLITEARVVLTPKVHQIIHSNNVRLRLRVALLAREAMYPLAILEHLAPPRIRQLKSRTKGDLRANKEQVECYLTLQISPRARKGPEAEAVVTSAESSNS